MLLRPYSMAPDGFLHAPLFAPYALYGQVDYIYGEKAYREHNGFTAAQAGLNLVESVGYVGYLWVVWRFGEGERRMVGGGWGGVACLVGFALSVMTVSKTVLYCEFFSFFFFSSSFLVRSGWLVGGVGGLLGGWLMRFEGSNEFFSGFENIGHNDALSLFFLWVVPK